MNIYWSLCVCVFNVYMSVHVMCASRHTWCYSYRDNHSTHPKCVCVCVCVLRTKDYVRVHVSSLCKRNFYKYLLLYAKKRRLNLETLEDVTSVPY